jgi:hypothetical protein
VKPFVPPKDVLYVDSYDEAYEPGIIMRWTAAAILEPAGVTLRYAFMDSKRKKDDADQVRVAGQIRALIDETHPDLVIAADDSACKFLVAPFYRNTRLPVVFIGVNWDASPYGLPCSNVTGQIEIELLGELIAELRKYASGERVGILSGNTLTDRTSFDYYRSSLGIRFRKSELVNSFQEWCRVYREMQTSCDILIVRNTAGIEGWDDLVAQRLVDSESRIPSGTVSTHCGKLVLVSFAKDNREFAEWGARRALEILAGRDPGSIPVSRNQRAKVVLNMKLAKALGVVFPMELIERAVFVEEIP